MAEEEKSQEIITILEAKEGKNSGEAIATYGRHNIVFLPKGAIVGQNVRVKLIALEKKDARGHTMYRGVPASDIEAEMYKDNGNGTVSRIKTRTNWLGIVSEVGMIETRPLAKREGQPSTKSDSKVVWGKDLPSSVIEERQSTLIPLEEEKVEDGQVVWWKTGEREENIKILSHLVKKIEVLNIEATWPWTNLDISTNGVRGNIRTDEERTSISLGTSFQEMPDWWQKEIEARFQVCVCGRYRYDVQCADGYKKCQTCREHEHCQSCGKESKITVINNQMVCDFCKANLDHEQLINQLLTAEQKTAIVAEVKKLLGSELILEKEGGEAVLRSSMDHLTSEARRSNLADKWSGYHRYFFLEDGIYGSKFSPAALKILEFLPQASGNGLVEIITWLSGGAKPGKHDYYTLRQIEGDSKVEFTFSTLEDLLKEIVVKLAAKESVLADLLRGSEKSRVEALAGYRKIVEKFGSDSSQAREVEEFLQNQKQDYSAALEKIREIEKLIAGEKSGETIVNFEARHRRKGGANNCDARVFRADGSSREPRNSAGRIGRDGTYTWPIVETDDLAIVWECERLKYIEDSVCKVVKFPKNGLTPDQRKAVAQFEKEIGMPKGSFFLEGKIKIKEVKEEIDKKIGAADMVAQMNAMFK
ncbi:hypothetical protein KKB43_04745 [Patescibacteria group bacterium]|nr:hypothetical protein [Patescibacteria group bacterium]